MARHHVCFKPRPKVPKKVHEFNGGEEFREDLNKQAARQRGFKKREGPPKVQGGRGVGREAVGRRIMIEGTYGFVYCSDNGFGMGVFTIKGEQFIGVDSGGVNYDGTAKEQEDGSIVLDVMLVPPELETMQSRASERRPHTRQFVTTLPPAFGNGKPQEITSVPGNVTVMIRQVRDDFLHPDVRPTLFDTHRLGAASDVYLKGRSGPD